MTLQDRIGSTEQMRFGREAGVAIGRRLPAHVIVCGNEKGGSGKSTLAVHIIAALLKRSCSVASIDLDARQTSLTRYLENRRRTSLRLA